MLVATSDGSYPLALPMNESIRLSPSSSVSNSERTLFKACLVLTISGTNSSSIFFTFFSFYFSNYRGGSFGTFSQNGDWCGNNWFHNRCLRFLNWGGGHSCWFRNFHSFCFLSLNNWNWFFFFRNLNWCRSHNFRCDGNSYWLLHNRNSFNWSLSYRNFLLFLFNRFLLFNFLNWCRNWDNFLFLHGFNRLFHFNRFSFFNWSFFWNRSFFLWHLNFFGVWTNLQIVNILFVMFMMMFLVLLVRSFLVFSLFLFTKHNWISSMVKLVLSLSVLR